VVFILNDADMKQYLKRINEAHKQQEEDETTDTGKHGCIECGSVNVKFLSTTIECQCQECNHEYTVKLVFSE